MTDKLKIGFTACYPHDYKFNRVVELPPQAAIEWARAVAPKASAGLDHKFEEVGSYSCWLNKLFVIVGQERGRWLAIYNHDGIFYLMRKEL